MFTALQALLNSLAVTFDLPILDWIQAHLQCTFLDVTMPIVTLFGDGGVFWIAVAVVLLLFAKYRKTGFSMGMALVLGLLVCNILLKPQVARIRPYNFQLQEYGREITLLVKGLNDYSFPSGHTIASLLTTAVKNAMLAFGTRVPNVSVRVVTPTASRISPVCAWAILTAGRRLHNTRRND